MALVRSARRGRSARRPAAALLGVLAAALGTFALAPPAGAHPLGNFTVNTSTRLVVGTDEVRARFVVDMAEIPTLRAKQEIDGNTDAYRASTCATIADGLLFFRGGERQVLRPLDSAVTFLPGQAGLETLRLVCTVSTGPSGVTGPVSFENRNFTDRVGWQEVTAAGDGTTLVGSDVPEVSTSRELTSYPEDLLATPPRQNTATFTVRTGGPTAQPADTFGAPGTASPGQPTSPLPKTLDRATRAFTGFVARQDLSLGVGPWPC